jgi:signal transduction histidine kinase
MLRTTHELKAPFAAIHAYTQVLTDGYVGDVPPEAARIVGRISARSRRLADEIQEMLQLANLTSMSQHPPEVAELDLAETLRWCIEQALPLAENRRVTVEANLAPARTLCVVDHVRMLLSNLIVNAVTYSTDGGRVGVRCHTEADMAPLVVIADEGIGIPAKKLPRIFEEHYRTNEAVRHNKESSGLGLAIVARVARLHDIRLTVKSQPAQGTTFQLRFPPVTGHRMSPFPKENQDGISADRR